jgi:hypothetical protein
MARGGRAAGIDRRDFHVASARQVAEQVVALEDEAEMLAAQLGQLVRQQLPVSRPATR